MSCWFNSRSPLLLLLLLMMMMMMKVTEGMSLPLVFTGCVSAFSPVQLDDFDAYFKEMSKDSAYKFSLQFEVQLLSDLLLFG